MGAQIIITQIKMILSQRRNHFLKNIIRKKKQENIKNKKTKKKQWHYIKDRMRMKGRHRCSASAVRGQ